MRSASRECDDEDQTHSHRALDIFRRAIWPECIARGFGRNTCRNLAGSRSLSPRTRKYYEEKLDPALLELVSPELRVIRTKAIPLSG